MTLPSGSLLLSVVARGVIEAGPGAILLAFVYRKIERANASLDSRVRLERSAHAATWAAVLLASAVLAVAGRHGRLGGAVLLNLGLTLMLTADRIHLRFYGDLVSVAELPNVWQLRRVLSSVRAALKASDISNYVDIGAAIVFWAFYGRLAKDLPDLPLTIRLVAASVLLGLALIASIPVVLAVRRDDKHIFNWRVARIHFVGVIGIFFYHLYEIVTYLNTLAGRNRITQPQREHVYRFVEQQRRTRERRSHLFGTARGASVVIVQAEALQTFAIGLRVRDQAVTPHLDVFLRESIGFVNFHDQTHIGATSDSVFVSLQSLHPLSAGAIATRYLANQYRGLPAILSENGYQTFAAMGGPGEYWNMRGLCQRLGFDRSYFDEFYRTGERFGDGLADKEFFSQTLPLIAAQADPFMAFLVTVSNHHPFELPAHHRTLLLGDLEGTVLGDYLHSVHYFDQAFGAFIAELRSLGVLDRSLVAVYGDHEGWLRDPAALGPLVGFSPDDSYADWKTRKRVPLMIRLPHGNHAFTSEVTGGHLDTAPTLLGLLGITDETSVMLGNDLSQGNDSLVVFRDGSFTDGRYSYINDVPSRCYDDRTGSAPPEDVVERLCRQALERLEISDRIIQGNLVRSAGIVRTAAGRGATPRSNSGRRLKSLMR
jgi:phosphoglycerol transferase MdoB-like AlkP superfamily enzyme